MPKEGGYNPHCSEHAAEDAAGDCKRDSGRLNGIIRHQREDMILKQGYDVLRQNGHGPQPKP